MTLGSSQERGSVWIVLPTYNEAENLPLIAPAILESLPDVTLLVVDDGSPDGTGELADALAAADPRVRVRHRAAKQGLGRAYLDGFGVALAGGAAVVVQMDADGSHDPAALPRLVAPSWRIARTSSSGRATYARRRRRRLGHRAKDHLARRQHLRQGRPRPAPARPDRRLQGLAGDDPGLDPVRRASTPAATSSRSR